MWHVDKCLLDRWRPLGASDVFEALADHTMPVRLLKLHGL